MTERIVDDFETVEIEESDAESSPGAQGVRDARAQQFAEMTPIGQAGQTVVVGDILRALRLCQRCRTRQPPSFG